MGKEEEAPRFVPLVRDSFVVREDRPWLPDDIELVHEKHQRVIRSWEGRSLDDISLTVRSSPEEDNFQDEECDDLSEIRKTRQRTVLLVSCFCFVCMAAIGIVFITARLGFGGRSQPSPPVSTPRPPPAPSDIPTEKPTSDLSSGVATTEDATASPTLSPSQVSDDGTGVAATPAPSYRTESETPVPVVTPIPTASPIESFVDPPTATPTIENTDDLIPLVDSLGIDDDETVAPSPESSSLSSQMESLIPTLQLSSNPTVIAEVSPGFTPVPSSSRTCNGLASNCNQRVNDLMFATLNNAMSSEEDGFDGPNHELRLEVRFVDCRGKNYLHWFHRATRISPTRINFLTLQEALDAGFRGLVLESCDCEDARIQLCSSSCISGTRDPARVFSNVVDFLNKDENANEVIIVVIKVDDQSL